MERCRGRRTLPAQLNLACYNHNCAFTSSCTTTTTIAAGRPPKPRSTMQMASSGLRALRGPQAPHTLGNPSRSIHTPAFISRSTPRPGSTVQGLFKQARTFLTSVVTQLTAPGTFATPANIPHASRSLLETSYHRSQTLQQRIHPVTRFTLSRPLGGPFLPRAPGVPRSVAHVGLGTARNFSSARPIFENLVQNVPIAGRAFCEADWDVKMQKERTVMRMKKGKKETQNKRKSMLKARETANSAESTTEEDAQAEFEQYFPTAPVETTTYLLIPLAPTPTSRLPLSVAPAVHTSNHPLLPLAYIASLHDDHATHSLRVSTVFARLDSANVFRQAGVSTAAYGGPGGLCTILEVKFVGWTEARVRSILGEAGTGWCVLEEVREDEHDSLGDALSEMSFDTGPNTGRHTPAHESDIDPAASFVLPTLDFSASFSSETGSWARQAAPTAPASEGLADLQFHNAWSASARDDAWSSDGLSDCSDSLSDLDMSGWGSSIAPSRRSSAGSSDGWASLNFSSSFVRRMQRDEGNEPREAMF